MRLRLALSHLRFNKIKHNLLIILNPFHDSELKKLRYALYASFTSPIRQHPWIKLDRIQLIYSYNLILLGTRSLNLHTQYILKQAIS